MNKDSNIVEKDHGMFEKSSGRKIASPLDFPPWCCQKCGENIGYIGRCLEFLAYPLLWASKSIFHYCPGLFIAPEKIAKGQSNKGANRFPVLSRLDGTRDK